MEALVRAMKQNVVATIAIGVICVAFLLFVVAPGLTSGSGSSGSQQATPTSLAVAKDQAFQVSTPTPFVPSPTSAGAMATSSTPSTPTATKTGTEYIVKAGDTLLAIANRFDTTVQAIATYNGLADENSLDIGQKLTIPGTSVSQQSLTPKPTDTAKPTNTVSALVSTPTAKPTNTPATPTNTPKPAATNTPKPTNTPPPPTATQAPPAPAANYVLTENRRLTACENHGMLRAQVTVVDKNGNPMNGIRILRLTMSNEWPAYAVTGDKGPGIAEFDLQAGDAGGGNWKVKVDMPGATSQWAENLATDLWLNEFCGDQLGVYHGHISYNVTFKYQG